jgi:hypothetical protein
VIPASSERRNDGRDRETTRQSRGESLADAAGLVLGESSMSDAN